MKNTQELDAKKGPDLIKELELARREFSQRELTEPTKAEIRSVLDKEMDNFTINNREGFGIIVETISSNVPALGMLGALWNVDTMKEAAKRGIRERGEAVVGQLANVALSDLKSREEKLIKRLSMLQQDTEDIIEGYETEKKRLEDELDRYKAKEEEIKLRALEKIKEGLTLDSKAIVDLKDAKKRISFLEGKLIEVNQNR